MNLPRGEEQGLGRSRQNAILDGLQVQNGTCRHSAVIFTIAEPQMEHPQARGSRLIVQRGMLMVRVDRVPVPWKPYRCAVLKI